MPQLSTRARRLPASPIRRLVPLADEASARGVYVHKLNIGQPDVTTPAAMIEAYQKFAEPVLAYGPSLGLATLRRAVAEDYERHGTPVAPTEVTVTVGGSEAIQFALTAVADPGDEVLVLEPFYANYAGFCVQLGVQVVPVASDFEMGFHLPRREIIEAAIGPKTRAIVVTSPGNPTGTVYSKSEMELLASIAERHGLFIISDETYRDFAYDGTTVTSALSLTAVQDRVIVVDSVSKRYSACGARVGFLVSRNAEINQAVMRMAFARLCPPTVDQMAAVAAYSTPASYFEEVRAEYVRRRNVLVDGLSKIRGVRTYRPEGAFYAMATLPVSDADAFAEWLLTDFSSHGETVMLAPGSGFYASPGLGRQQARIAYVVECASLVRSVEILDEALDLYARMQDSSDRSTRGGQS